MVPLSANYKRELITYVSWAENINILYNSIPAGLGIIPEI